MYHVKPLKTFSRFQITMYTLSINFIFRRKFPILTLMANEMSLSISMTRIYSVMLFVKMAVKF